MFILSLATTAKSQLPMFSISPYLPIEILIGLGPKSLHRLSPKDDLIFS